MKVGYSENLCRRISCNWLIRGAYNDSLDPDGVCWDNRFA
nr:MAG TPA: hypothetical protein [Caudoviricetes sp.]